MGIGITQVAALVAKKPVLLMDNSEVQLQKQLAFLGINSILLVLKKSFSTKRY